MTSGNVNPFILPSEEQTWLLRACLWSGEPGRAAWHVWNERVGLARCVRDGGRGVKPVLPLLQQALRRNAIEIDGALLTHVRTVCVLEDLRSRAYRRMCGEVFSAFRGAGIRFIVLKAAALADAVYDHPTLRHCHDIDLLIHDADVSAARLVLPPLEFTPSADPLNRGPLHLKYEHTSRLPLELHLVPFRTTYYRVPLADWWTRSEARRIADVNVRILSPADQLLHLCAHAASSEIRRSIRWVCDVWFLIHRHPDLDWDVLLDCARRSHLAWPLAVTLGYLREAFDAPIPTGVLDRLGATAETDAIGRAAAWMSTRAGARRGLNKVIQMVGRRPAQARVIAWMLFPSPRYVRAAFQSPRPWLLPFYYLYRPLKYLTRHVRGRWKTAASKTG